MNTPSDHAGITSADSPLRLDKVVSDHTDTGGWVALTLAPGKVGVGLYGRWRRDLDTDLKSIIAAGASLLVPLLEDDELTYWGIPTLVSRAQDLGLNALRYPFHDGGIPPSLDSLALFIDELANRVQSGERLVIHCAGGLGRAGLVGACLRLRLGLDSAAEEAIECIRQLRDRRAIETLAQERFVASYAHRMGLV